MLCPLHKAYKRGTSSSKWQIAYQAVKHDRVNNQKSGNIGNLLLALGALYILNIYYRGANFPNVTDETASNIDWGLGSELFLVKISPETTGKSVKDIYVKKEDYDESIYLVKHTDDTAKVMVELFDEIQNEVNKNTSFGVTEHFKEMEKAGKLLTDCPDMPIVDVAFKCGFDEASNFTHTFKRIYGCSPTQYRDRK